MNQLEMMYNKVYYIENRRINFYELQMPQLNNSYVRVKNLYCGICGGDYSHYIGRRQESLSIGHEAVGIVIDSNDCNYRTGDYVITDFNYRCNSCYYCKTNKSHLCNSNDISLFSNRMMALYSDINSNYLLKINKPQPLYIGSLIEPLSCCLHAFELLRLNTNDNILIFGTGSIGTLMAFYLKEILKYKNIYVYDTIETRMNNTCDLFNIKPIQWDLHYHLIFEATNSESGLMQSVCLASKGQTLCSMSHLYGDNISEIIFAIQKKEIQPIFPLRNGNKNNLMRAYEYLSKHWETNYDAFCKIYKIHDIENAFRERANSSYNKHIIQIDE